MTDDDSRYSKKRQTPLIIPPWIPLKERNTIDLPPFDLPLEPQPYDAPPAREERSASETGDK